MNGIVRKTINAPQMKRQLYSKAAPYGGVPAIPVNIAYEHPNTRMRVMRTGDRYLQTWGKGLVVKDRGFILNGPQLLDVFASIRTPDEVVPFLEFCGPFRDRGLAAQEITWSEFQGWQRFVYALRMGTLSEWPHKFTSVELHEAITDPEPVMPHFVGQKRLRVMEFYPKTALEYIGAVVYVDYLRAVDLHVCRLPTCRKLFERKSDREQFYCSHPHGRQHKKSLERQAAKAANKAEGTNGKA